MCPRADCLDKVKLVTCCQEFFGVVQIDSKLRASHGTVRPPDSVLMDIVIKWKEQSSIDNSMISDAANICHYQFTTRAALCPVQVPGVPAVCFENEQHPIAHCHQVVGSGVEWVTA